MFRRCRETLGDAGKATFWFLLALGTLCVPFPARGDDGGPLRRGGGDHPAARWLDLSHQALLRAQSSFPGVVRAVAESLPFADDTFDGCRIERVLQHVIAPARVVDEVLRVVRPGGLVAVLEPDHTSFLVESSLVPDGTLPGRYVSTRHLAIGTEVASLLRERGCVVDDIVTETSFGYDLRKLPVGAELATLRAVQAGELEPSLRQAWLGEQRERSTAGTFQATWTKILVVARPPSRSGS